MSTEATVCEIFHNMDYKEILHSNKEGELWMERYRESDHFGGHIPDESNEVTDGIDDTVWEQILTKFLSTLEEKRDLLVQILNLTLYDAKDSKEIVNVFCKDLNYYFENACTFNKNDEEVVYLEISIRDIYILGRLLAPLLISGCDIRIHPLDESVIPYLVAIGDIITKAGSPRGYKYKFVNSVVPFLCMLDIIGDSTPSNTYCPMIIFQESDLDSALECLLEQNCRFKGMLYWSITHAYIQESVFNDVVYKLQDISKRGHNIEFINCEQRERLKHLMNNVPKFLIGWDPRELEYDTDLTMTVCLLPFRTMDEVVSLVNSYGSGCASSIWTDKLSTANRLIKLLKIENIWINSHGRLDPSVPFESITETRVPFNGPQLMEFLNKGTSIFPDLFSILVPCDSSSSEIQNKKYLFKNSIEEAIDFANDGYETLNKLDRKGIQQLLNLLPAEKDTKTIDLASSVISRLDSIYHPSSTMDVLSFSIPYKIVLVTFTSKTIGVDLFLQVLYCLIVTKNAMIVRAPAELLVDIANILPTTLPKGIVSLVDIKLNFEKNLKTKKIGKSFKFHAVVLKSNFAGLRAGDLCSLFSCNKMIWISAE